MVHYVNNTKKQLYDALVNVVLLNLYIVMISSIVGTGRVGFSRGARKGGGGARV